MKTKFLIPLLPLLVLLAGCKESGCEKYEPYASSEAIAAWKEYTTGQENSWECYNSVQVALDYFGSRLKGHDSMIVQHKRDTLLLRGYVREYDRNANGFWFLVDDTTETLEYDKCLHVLEIERVPDSTKPVYLMGRLQIIPMENYRTLYPDMEQFKDPCHEFTYTIRCLEITKNTN